MPNRWYSQNGTPRLQPGSLTKSDHKSTIGRLPLLTPTYSQVTLAAAAVFPVSSIVSLTFAFPLISQVIRFNVQTGSVVTPDILVGLITNMTLNTPLVVSSSGANIIISSTIVAGAGAFTTVIDGTSYALSATSADGLPLEAGRYVVPVTDNFNVGLELGGFTPRYRYPALTDTASLLAAGGFVIRDNHTNGGFRLNMTIFDFGLVTQGSEFAVLTRGSLIVDPVTAVPSAIAPLFMNTDAAGSTLAGRLTVTATANTIPVPAGIIQVISGSTVAGRSVEIVKN